MSDRTVVETRECLDCGFRGSAAEARRHAEERGCRNFRIHTRVLSSTGRILDRRVEVFQIESPTPRLRQGASRRRRPAC